MADPTPLSPAARAVWEAFNSKHSLAAALEALADQVAPPPSLYDPIPDGADRQEWIRDDILRIAAELEAKQ